MLVDLFQGLSQWVESVVLTFGAPGITLIALLENLFPPTPSEFLYPLAGKLTFEGQLHIPIVVLAGVAGSLVGALIYYTIGYQLGEVRVRGFIERYGRLHLGRFKITLMSLGDYERALALFEKRGGIIVLLVRLLPLVHGVISIPAGVTRMPLWSFLLYSAIGSALWIAPLVLLGNWLGSQWEIILEWMDVYENFWYVVIALVCAYWLWRRWRSRKTLAIDSSSHPDAP